MPSTPSKFNLQKQEVKIQFSHPNSSTRLKELAELPTDYSHGNTEMMEYDHPYEIGMTEQQDSPTKKNLRIQIPEKPKKKKKQSKEAIKGVIEQQPEVVQVKYDVNHVRNLFLIGFICPLLWFYVWNKYRKGQEWEKDTQQYIYASRIMAIISIIVFIVALFSIVTIGSLYLFSR